MFDSQEIATLVREYRLALEPSPDQEHSIRALDLLDSEKGQSYLTKFGPVFETTSDTAIVSLFAKKYSYLMVASTLYAMSVFRKAIDYSLENSYVESYFRGDIWLPEVRFNPQKLLVLGQEGDHVWRDQVIYNLFAGNLSRVWTALRLYTPISKAVLWENTATCVYSLYETKFRDNLDSVAEARLHQDYQYLIEEAPAHLFGESYNPLTRFNTAKCITTASDTPLRIRKTCCYSYLASDDPEDYCSICPKIKHEKLT